MLAATAGFQVGGPHDFSPARKAIVAAIGDAEIRRLHRPNALYDAVSVVGLWGLFGLLIYLLGTLPIGVAWAACLVLQGFVIMAFGYVMHEHFVHRLVGGRRFSSVMGFLAGFVAHQLKTFYAHTHREHHLHTGVDPDEEYKQDIDTRWKRWLYCTAPGSYLATRRWLRSERPPRWPAPDGTFEDPRDGALRRRIRLERRLRILGWVLIAGAAALWPRFVLLGYVLPFLVTFPVANALRLVLEHAETNPENAYHCATYYRTGPVSRLLFFWDAGDCHLVHHLFPNIPFYRMGRACRILRPLLVERGVRERRSLVELCYGYFVRNEPHRTLWQNRV
ncbi:MAG: fatty acid desaturase family protein [Planctomycetota bacterium]